MKLNKSLNLVLPVERGDGTRAWVHAQPIGEEVFDRFFLPLTKTYAETFAQKLGQFAGARVAALMLKKLAIESGEWEGPDGVQNALLPEIRRLANVIAPIGPWSTAQPAVQATETEPARPIVPSQPARWEPVPIDMAVTAKAIDAEDAKEVENILVFFTLCSWVPYRAERATMVGAMAAFWLGQTTSSGSTAFAASLPTSTATASSGQKAGQSSIPS